ncbi:hypothetical protein Rhopal_002564-T1 [Rhodotorula paludigena]|uniref:Kinesin motor domain-containing protein n=1 Tax=Rhodotorula paludigena TaxID=86838 RepID=A0AAV5GJN4_9BASI|nr:hypothetical protein Rhopal_002564-T1 [Rhodotorula paludigena]
MATTTSTPRKPLQATRPVSRASSRPSSPTKPSSLNTTSSRPASRASTAASAATSSRALSSAEAGPSSPTKRLSSSLGCRSTPSSSRIRTSTASTASAAVRPTSSIASLRSSVAGAGPSARTSTASTIVSSTSFADSLAEADDETDDAAADASDADLPRRRAGFGPSTPMRADGPLREADGHDSLLEGSSADEGDETEMDDDEDKSGQKQNVVVCLRVRPPKSTATPSAPIYSLSSSTATLSLTSSHPTLLKRFGSSTHVPKALSDEYEYRFDLLHEHPSPTLELYDRKIKPVVKAALAGFNGTVFAYGQTASGKTHTMTGSPLEPGIIPLSIDELFLAIRAQRSRRSYSLRVSFLEIYNEQLRDLLASPAGAGAGAGARGPEIVEGGAVKNLEERAVALPDEVLEVLREGEARRRVGATDWNERSSRSHCVFTVTIESMSKKDGSARTSKLNLIDLAGSESATGQEDRRKEGSFINRSLLTLGTVIGKLSDPSTASSHIPYRDSKLTRLLQPALSGNSRVAVVCTVSPDAEQATETLSTLKFAKRAKMVVTKAERGVLVTDAILLTQYSAKIAALQQQIASLESGLPTSSPTSPSSPSSSALLASERDSAISRLSAAEAAALAAQDALSAKDDELARLRDLLDQTRRMVLNGPELERSARRVSGAGAGELEEVLSPSRSRSLRLGLGTPGGGGGAGARGGMRTVSEMSALGRGTPSRLAGRASIGGRLAEEDEFREKEANLNNQLAAAQSELDSLRHTTAELDSLRADLASARDAAASAQQEATQASEASAARQQRVEELEREVARLTTEVAALTSERDSLRRELEQSRARLEEAQQSGDERVSALQARVDAAEEAHSTAQVALEDAEARQLKSNAAAKERDSRLKHLEADIAALEQRLAAKDADAAVLSGSQGETISSLEREVASVQAELASVVAAREAAITAAQDEAGSARTERDLALKAVEAVEQRLREVEELAALQAQQHAAAEDQTQREKDAAVRALEAEQQRLEVELRAKIDKVEQLQRAVDHYERLEAQRQTYEKNTRAGTDLLKSRLAELTSRKSTPVTPLARSVSGASHASQISSAAGGAASTAPSAAETHVELQIRNDELASRVHELEKQVESAGEASELEVASAQRESTELRSALDLQQRQLDETEARAEDWKQKYLAAQRLLDQLLAAQNGTASASSSDTENRRPSSTFSAGASDAAKTRASSLSRRAPLSSSQSPTRPSMHSPQPSWSSTAAPSSPWSKTAPPPLPYSPHQRDKERARKARRETIARDLAKLKEGKVVGEKREGWDSPSGSPVKSSFGGGVGKWSS